ncbi:MAG: gamma-glutamyl-gamma-aminobutyrate hydrolase family protein [Acidobacteria bacterium]|nr:gamma-glutamyl-gamma-aminobutyrate hydrolase family protein [Acidobacteriota bacterium]
MRPVIGIGCDVEPSPHGEGRELMYVYGTYLEAIEMAGAIPLLLPPIEEVLERTLPLLDGVILAGGDDLDPASYGEANAACRELLDGRRQRHDLALARLTREQRIPTLGICLGAQLINVAAAGSLVQDIGSTLPESIQHTGRTGTRGRHRVSIEQRSRLAAVLGAIEVDVNSGHHQAVKDPGRGLSIVARSGDGVVEAIEDASHPFYVGVQWHPEEMLAEESAQRLFHAFVEAARTCGRLRRKS